MLTSFWQGALPAPAAMWNLHTTQPRYFAPTCSEVVVVGMTTWVGQGQSHLPSDVLGITATSSQRGRLQPKGRLRQQPAGIFITGGPSRQRRQKPSNKRFIKSNVAPTRSTEAGDQRDASHAQPPPTTTGKSLLHKRIRERQEAYAPNMLVQGEKTLYKVACAQTKGQRTAGPMSRPQPRRSWQPGSRTPNCNQAPAYISGPLE
jgi:hypothetical protein